MRIATIGPLPPWRGGVAHHAGELLKALRRSHKVLAVSYSAMYPAWLYPGQAAPPGSRAAAEDADVTWVVNGSDPRTWREAVGAITDWQPQAVIMPWWTVYWAPLSIYTARALARRGIPTHFLCHNVFDHDARWWTKRLARKALAQAAGFITHTEQNGHRLRDLFPSTPVEVFPHPSYQHFPKPDRVPQREAGLELLFFGYVRRYKGLDLLIEALGMLPDLDFHLEIAGEPWIDRQPLVERMRQLGILERVTATQRYVEDREAAGLITRADAVILPYRQASGSGVAALALHYDKPVIATRVGGLAEYVVDGETGYLVAPGDASALAGGIAQLARPRDWRRSIAPHKRALTWQGLAAAVVRSICAAESSLAHESAAG
ncbi:MAG: glycosyltransferase [Chromatiales bacterium]